MEKTQNEIAGVKPVLIWYKLKLAMDANVAFIHTFRSCSGERSCDVDTGVAQLHDFQVVASLQIYWEKKRIMNFKKFG